MSAFEDTDTTEQLAFVFPPHGARFIRLTRGKVTVVDEADYERLNERRWIACTNGRGYTYARSWSGKSSVLMHRLILSAPDGMDVDHRNGSTLDNRRSNLRICTRSENVRNSRKAPGTASRYKGVSYSNGRWLARIGVDGCRLCLGSFQSELEAAHAYDDAARRHFGAFAAPNFPESAA